LRRSKQILPGLRLNLSKSGMSVSVGGRGAHYTVGPRGTRATLGVPGTGLSYTTYSSHHARRAADEHARKGSAVRSTTPSGRSATRSAAVTPAAKLGWGVALIIFGLLLLAVLWPLAILLLTSGGAVAWVATNQSKEPKWQVRALLRKAHQNLGGRALLEQALAIDPENPEALAACAGDAYQNEDWSAASSLYERYLLKVPDDEQAELHLGFSYLNAGKLDPALEHLEKIRARSGADERPGLVNAVAVTLLKKADPGQALEILKTLPLRRQKLDEALQLGLFLRSMARYGLRKMAGAMSDLDRLYAINPEYPGIAAVRDTMRAGTFSVASVHFQISAGP
jgi:tetratricopeptide (TPR) repeat protein